jgi:2-aminoadipate transaminase
MVSLIQEMMPESVTCTHPKGGMFVWMTLPEKVSSMEVFENAIRDHVAVLPGTPFYVDGGGNNTLRINFSNATPDKIRTGIERLACVIHALEKR